MRHVAFVLIAATFLAAVPLGAPDARASRANAGAISFEAPEGWARRDLQGTTFFVAPAGDARLAVLPAESSDEHFDRWFDAAWRSLKREFRDPQEVPVAAKSSRAYDHRLVAGSMAGPDGAFVYVTFWAAKEKKGGRLQAVLFVADSLSAYDGGSTAVSQALSSVKFVAGDVVAGTRPAMAWVVAGGPGPTSAGPARDASAPASATTAAEARGNPGSGSERVPGRTGTARDFVGTWKSGGVSPVGFYDPSTGSWAAPSGAGQSYEIRPDGTFVYAGLLQTSMYSCTTSVFVYKTGTWRLDGARLVFRDKDAKIRSTDNCNKKFNYDRKSPPETESYPWRFESDEYGSYLVLTDGETGDLRLRRE